MAYFPSKGENNDDGKLVKPHRAVLPWLIRLSVALTFVLALGLLWRSWLYNILYSNGFEPHGACYLWLPSLVVLHVGSDALIGLSYVCISATLAYLVYRTRRDIPFQWVFIAFGIFIIACGATHFLEIWTLWHATYWLSGVVKLITAVASVTTAVALFPLLPAVLTVIENTKISEERKQQLEQAHKELEVLYKRNQELDELKTQFFANVSHELRTPLTLILGPVRNLLAEKHLTEKQVNDLEVVERNASTLLNRVNDLLDIARLEAGQMNLNYSEIDLAQVLHLCVSHFEVLARERSVTLALEIPSSLPMQGDAEKLQRVFLNLLSNAFKFTPVGGSLRCTLYAEGERAIVSIQDNGPGIPAEIRQSIFERFSQGESGTARHFGGSGLGLTIVKEFVELHSGSIVISDAPGGGALFTVVLPIGALAHISQLNVQSPIFEAGVSEEYAFQTLSELSFGLQHHENAQGMSFSETDAAIVLIIEDNAEMSRFIADTLREYRTATAFDGQEGLEKALALQPDLILCDIMMPKMNGDQFVAKARTYAELDSVPILLLSARADDSLRVQLLHEGAQDYLVKPFFPDELRVRAANLIAMKQARHVLQRELANQNQDIVVLAHEVTSRKHEIQHILEDLRLSEENFRILADAMPQIVWTARPDGWLDYYNQKWFEYTGTTLEQSQGWGWESVVHPDDLQKCMNRWKHSLETGENFEVEYRFQAAADGVYRWHLGRALAVKDSNGTITRWFGTGTDIDDQKRIEDTLRLSEVHLQDQTKELELRSRELERTNENLGRQRDELTTLNSALEQANLVRSQFLATMSHELRTPLTAIIGFSEMLLGDAQEAGFDQVQQSSLELILNNSGHLLGLINDVLDLSKMEMGRIELDSSQVDLKDLLGKVAAELQSIAIKRNLFLRTEVDEGIGFLESNPQKLRQVLINLVSNALKFTEQGGVTLSARRVISPDQKGECVSIAVKDSGIGISPDLHERIFEAFYQADMSYARKVGGTGLGLAIVNQLTGLLGGTITVESAPGKGSTFTMILPVRAASSSQGTTHPDPGGKWLS